MCVIMSQLRHFLLSTLLVAARETGLVAGEHRVAGFLQGNFLSTLTEHCMVFMITEIPMNMKIFCLT